MIHVFVISSSSFHGLLTNQLNDQIRVGFLAQLAEPCMPLYLSSQLRQSRTRLNFSGFLFATVKDASITSLNLTLTLYHCFCVVGSYAILMCGVLDFSLYYTHDNSPCGLPLQNVSGKFSFSVL